MKKEFTTNICLACIKKSGYGCCEEDPVLPLTVEDLNRLVKMGFNIDDFLIAQKYNKSDIEGTEKWWKSGMIKIKGKMYKLNIRKDKKGRCYFLKPGKGCTLGKHRPYVCRTYPFWISPKGKVVYAEGEDKDCYIGQCGYSPKDGLKLIKENEKDLKFCFNKIKKDALSKKDKAEAKIVLEKILEKKK